MTKNFKYLIIFLAAAGLAGAVMGWQFFVPAYRGGEGRIVHPDNSLEVIEVGDKKVVRNKKEKYEVTVPMIFDNQPLQKSLDFYTKDTGCKLSFEVINKDGTKSLSELISMSSDQLKYMTVLKEELKFLNSEKTRAIYTLDTEETGLSRVYYEDAGKSFIQIYIYSPDKKSNCYNEIYNLTTSKY